MTGNRCSPNPVHERPFPQVPEPSAFAETTREGIYLRRESDEYLEDRAKLVNPDFTQAIGEHWSRGALRTNPLGEDVPGAGNSLGKRDA